MINTYKIYAASSIEDLLNELLTSTQKDDANNLANFLKAFLEFAIPLSGLCVFLLVAFATYKLMTSRGDPDRLSEAKNEITNAIVGFVFILLSIAILMLLSHIIGIDISGN